MSGNVGGAGGCAGTWRRWALRSRCRCPRAACLTRKLPRAALPSWRASSPAQALGLQLTRAMVGPIMCITVTECHCGGALACSQVRDARPMLPHTEVREAPLTRHLFCPAVGWGAEAHATHVDARPSLSGAQTVLQASCVSCRSGEVLEIADSFHQVSAQGASGQSRVARSFSRTESQPEQQ